MPYESHLRIRVCIALPFCNAYNIYTDVVKRGIITHLRTIMALNCNHWLDRDCLAHRQGLDTMRLLRRQHHLPSKTRPDRDLVWPGQTCLASMYFDTQFSQSIYCTTTSQCLLITSATTP